LFEEEEKGREEAHAAGGSILAEEELWILAYYGRETGEAGGKVRIKERKRERERRADRSRSAWRSESERRDTMNEPRASFVFRDKRVVSFRCQCRHATAMAVGR